MALMVLIEENRKENFKLSYVKALFTLLDSENAGDLRAQKLAYTAAQTLPASASRTKLFNKISTHPQLHPEIAAKLIDHPTPKVQVALLRRNDIGLDQALRVLKDPSRPAEVIAAALAHRNMTEEHLVKARNAWRAVYTDEFLNRYETANFDTVVFAAHKAFDDHARFSFHMNALAHVAALETGENSLAVKMLRRHEEKISEKLDPAAHFYLTDQHVHVLFGACANLDFGPEKLLEIFNASPEHYVYACTYFAHWLRREDVTSQYYDQLADAWSKQREQQENSYAGTWRHNRPVNYFQNMFRNQTKPYLRVRNYDPVNLVKSYVMVPEQKLGIVDRLTFFKTLPSWLQTSEILLETLTPVYSKLTRSVVDSFFEATKDNTVPLTPLMLLQQYLTTSRHSFPYWATFYPELIAEVYPTTAPAMWMGVLSSSNVHQNVVEALSECLRKDTDAPKNLWVSVCKRTTNLDDLLPDVPMTVLLSLSRDGKDGMKAKVTEFLCDILLSTADEDENVMLVRTQVLNELYGTSMSANSMIEAAINALG